MLYIWPYFTGILNTSYVACQQLKHRKHNNMDLIFNVIKANFIFMILNSVMWCVLIILLFCVWMYRGQQYYLQLPLRCIQQRRPCFYGRGNNSQYAPSPLQHFSHSSRYDLKKTTMWQQIDPSLSLLLNLLACWLFVLLQFVVFTRWTHLSKHTDWPGKYTTV